VDPRRVVTALRGAGRGRVAVELDGVPWCTVPPEAAETAGLAVGVELDGSELKALRDEADRLDALAAALGALRHRDHSASSLERRLERRGIAANQRRRTLATLTRVGVVDDARFAHARAQSLAERGSGDLLIADDLRSQGVPPELAEEALAALEAETARARAIVSRRGPGAKTWRYLASKGFTAETLESLVADGDDGAIA
jgi:SOS response regulatory protein OraA/RecX